MTAVVIVEGIAIVLLGLLVVGLLRSHAEILRRLHELGAGLESDDGVESDEETVAAPPTLQGSAHDVEGITADQESVSIAVAGAQHDTVLAFLSTTCLACAEFWQTFSAPHELPAGARLIVIVQESDSVRRLRKVAPPDVLVVRSDAAWQDYDVPGSPHFVHVDGPRAAVLGEGTADTWAQVLDLLGQARASMITPRRDPPRDNAERVDRELLASGIGPGHPSLSAPVDDPSRDGDG